MSSQEVATRPEVAVNPITGQVVELGDDTATNVLLTALDEFDEMKRRADAEYRRLVNDEIVRRMDKRRRWNGTLDGYEFKAPSDAPAVEYDKDTLSRALQGLVKARRIDQEAVNDAIELICDYVVHAGALEKLRKNPEYAAVIDAHRVEKPKAARRVSVRRVGS